MNRAGLISAQRCRTAVISWLPLVAWTHIAVIFYATSSGLSDVETWAYRALKYWGGSLKGRCAAAAARTAPYCVSSVASNGTGYGRMARRPACGRFRTDPARVGFRARRRLVGCTDGY